MSRLLALALLPAGILLGYIYRMDTIEKEPTKLLIRLFLFGCLCAIPASILEGIGTTLLDGVDSTLIKLLADAFLVVAVAEEGCKFYLASDAHHIRELDLVPRRAPEVISRLGLDETHQFHIG